jgi:two-component system, chemotaxis family, response regulator Rcp1
VRLVGLLRKKIATAWLGMSAAPYPAPERTAVRKEKSADSFAPPLADRVLLVEDSEEDIVLFRRLLVRADVRVALDVAMDGETAIRWLSEKLAEVGCGRPVLPRAIFLDLKLPGASGSEVLRWIRAQPELERTLVAICSASTAERDLAEAESLGAHVYITKFPGPERLAAILAFSDPRELPRDLTCFVTVH